MGELLLRMVFSLAVVVGLLILISRVAARRLHGRAGSPIEVLHRQALSKSASVSVVSVAGRVLVLGSTDQQVNVLTELAPDALVTAESHDDKAEDPAEDPADEQEPALDLGDLLEASYGTDALPSLEALLAEPDQVTLEELFGHRPPAHAAPAATPADAAAAYAAPAEPVAPPAPVAVQDEEDPYLPEDPSYAAFASALRAQLATGAHGAPAAPTAHATAQPGGRTGRHAAPAPAMELPPAVTGGARVARPAEPVSAPIPTPAPAAAPSVATAPAGPSAADLAALRAALLSAQLQAGTTAEVRTTAPSATRPAPESAAQPDLRPGFQPEGALSGSVLSPSTWRQAYRAVTRRAS